MYHCILLQFIYCSLVHHFESMPDCDVFLSNVAGTQECNMTVNSQPYFEACLYDGCANPDDLTGPFSAYLAYLRECTGRQLLPSDWRFPEILDPSK